MALVLSDNVQAGMVLAREVVDARGRLLIPAGQELSERHVGALLQWGIPTVDVEGDVNDPTTEIDPEVLHIVEEEVRERFVIAGEPCVFLEALQEQAVLRSARGRALEGAEVAP